MKKHAAKTKQESAIFSAGKDTTSRVLLIAAIILYSISLILLANLAYAERSSQLGALIKVNSTLDGNAFYELHADVRAVSGNILAIDLPTSSLSQLNKVKGLCSSQLDTKQNVQLGLEMEQMVRKYAGAAAVVGILNNRGVLGTTTISGLKKVEAGSNVGFISYISDNPNSTVIMHNLKNGESNLIQALLYMVDYAKTVNKPLVIELQVGESELNNPLFVQVCQKFAETGIQFLRSAIPLQITPKAAPVQMAFSTFNSETGQITDQTDFWAIEEVKQQQLMLLGSDRNMCSIFFRTEAGFDKVYLSNNSMDLVMVTTISSDGSVYYYHITNKETALIPRILSNGTPLLEDGVAGIFPYHSKGILFNDAMASKQFVALKTNKQEVLLNTQSGLRMMVGSPEGRTLAMSLDNICPDLEVEVSNELGETIYRSNPEKDTRSMKTRIDLPESHSDLYFLELRSPEFQQTFALQMAK